jgi:hypothetical protein
VNLAAAEVEGTTRGLRPTRTVRTHRCQWYTGESGAAPRTRGHRLASVSVAAAIGLGAVVGLAIGIVVSVGTDVPFAPEAGLVLGALVGWLSRRNHA